MVKKTAIGFLFLVVFLISIGATFQYINRDNQELTMELAKPTIPVMRLIYEEDYCNSLYGYTSEMDMVSVADHIIDIGLDREINGTIVTRGNDINRITLQVRNMDATRLIEEISVEYEDADLVEYDFSFTFNDLVSLDEEYILHFIVDLASGEKVHYYTRFWYVEESATSKQIEYIMNFHGNCLDETKRSDIAKVLETNSTQSNKNLSYVNIHSSVDQVMFGDLDVIKLFSGELNISYLDTEYGGYTYSYYLMTKDSEHEYYYKIVEKYLLRTVGDKIYLINFERTMDTIMDLNSFVFEGDTINLGISSDIPDIYESEEGKMVAFVKNGSLYLYDDNENQYKLIYNNYVNSAEELALNTQQNIKVLRIDESGSMYFMVYGYFNSGKYEGKTGILIYAYDGTGNIIKEIGMIESNKHATLVMQEIDEVAYLNNDGYLYFMYEGNICDYHIEDGATQVWIPYREDAKLIVSQSQSSILRVVGEMVYLYDLDKNFMKEFGKNPEETISVQGFIGEDYLYGIGHRSDYITNPDGTISYLMHKLFIESTDGKVKKEYAEPSILVKGTKIEGTQIVINRMQKTADGYEPTSDDYIMSNISLMTAENMIEENYVSRYQTVQSVELMNQVNTKTLEKLTATELMYEGDLSIEIPIEQEAEYYLVGTPYERIGYVLDPGEAVIKADLVEGYSRDENGSYLWKKQQLSVVNQIMAITQPEICEPGTSLNICLDTMLLQMNNPRETQVELAKGVTCQEILSSSLLDYNYLDVTGASLRSMLYYLDQDIPILALLENSEAVLITGYNQFNVVIFDPITGTLYKRSMSDATAWFAEHGNRFMTYYRYQNN